MNDDDDDEANLMEGSVIENGFGEEIIDIYIYILKFIAADT